MIWPNCTIPVGFQGGLPMGSLGRVAMRSQDGPFGPMGLGDPWALGTLGPGDPWALGAAALGAPYIIQIFSQK